LYPIKDKDSLLSFLGKDGKGLDWTLLAKLPGTLLCAISNNASYRPKCGCAKNGGPEIGGPEYAGPTTGVENAGPNNYAE